MALSFNNTQRMAGFRQVGGAGCSTNLALRHISDQRGADTLAPSSVRSLHELAELVSRRACTGVWKRKHTCREPGCWPEADFSAEIGASAELYRLSKG